MLAALLLPLLAAAPMEEPVFLAVGAGADGASPPLDGNPVPIVRFEQKRIT